MNSDKVVFLSLGFGCESRNLIDQITVPGISRPFDNIITPKNKLLETFRNNGNIFTFAAEDCNPNTSRAPYTFGFEANGLFYMHEFPKDQDFRGADDWEKKVNSLSSKYQKRWKNFSTLCRDPTFEKVFFLSNSQYNFRYFGDINVDLHNSFGIDDFYLIKLLDEFDRFGVENFKLIILFGNIDNYLSANSIPSRYGDKIIKRFVGTITWPVPDMIVRELSYALFDAKYHGPNISLVCGTYIGGMKIAKTSDTTAIVTNHAGPIGEVKTYPGGFIITFAEGTDFTLKASISEGKLRFATNEMWTKVDG